MPESFACSSNKHHNWAVAVTGWAVIFFGLFSCFSWFLACC